MKSVALVLLFLGVSHPVFAQEPEQTFECSLGEWSQTLDAQQQAALRASLTSSIGNYDQLAKTVKLQIRPIQYKVTVVGDPTVHSTEHLLAIGTQVGLYAPLTFEIVDVMRRSGSRWIDASLKIQPSHYQQAVSVAGDYHLFQSRFYAGAHGTLTYLRAPWDPYYDRKLDHVYGVGVQGGIRGFMGSKQRLLGTLEVGSTWSISRLYDRPMTFHVAVGIAYRMKKL